MLRFTGMPQRTLADSAVAFVAQGIEERVLTHVTATCDNMVGALRKATEAAIVTLAEGIQGDINHGVVALVVVVGGVGRHANEIHAVDGDRMRAA